MILVRTLFALSAIAIGSASALAVAVPAPSEGAPGRVFRVWLKEGVQADPRAESTDGHPCGGVSYRRDRVVPVEDEYVIPEEVLEYDAGGAVLRRWRVPVDVIVYGVSGDSILVSDNQESLWIDTAGRARQTAFRQQSLGALEGGFTCPNDSCEKFMDAGSGETRLIGSTAVCS